ncbi:MAG: twin-arginine translocation signal domain-containing protein [Anaerolineales bacterium]|nr:twin-arginine translocation signal domain-containing protein [Anaerolineales bacterium]
MAARKFSRREFIRFAGLGAGAAVLGACAPQVVTQVVQETQVVSSTQIVNQTQVVEVPNAVTATPLPPLMTIQGRELPPDAAPLEKQIVFDPGAEPKHLDVARDLFSATAVLNWGAEPLLRLDENQNIVPALAESYVGGPDAKYWDFTIRQDAKWSDGVPITADDWVFTFQHYADPELANPFLYFYTSTVKGMQAYFDGTGTREEVGVEKIDDRTFRIHGVDSVPHVPAMMTYQAVVPAPKHKAEADKLHWADTMEGAVFSGPMKLTTWEHNKTMIWEQNEYYNGPFKPGIGFVKQIIGDGTNWFAAWQNHEIDMIPILDPAQLAIVRADPALNPLLHWWLDPKPEYFTLDTLKGPTANHDLRLALARSIDRATLCNDVLKGTETPNLTMLTPGFPGYSADLQSFQAYDVAAAQQSMIDAGYPGGVDPATGQPLQLTITFRGVDPYVEFAKEQWETNLGIKVELVQQENQVWRQMRGEKTMQIFHNFYEYDFMDPVNLLTDQWKSDGVTGARQAAWINPTFDDLVTQAGREPDPAKRLELFQQAEKVLVEDVAGVFLCTMNIFQVWWPYISGIKPNSRGEVAFRYLDVSRFQMYINNTVDQYRTATL